jgi:hypothetical protein
MTTHSQSSNKPQASPEGRFSQKFSNGLSKLSSGTTLVAIGFLTGAGILLFDYIPFQTEESRWLIRLAPFQLFLFAVVAQTVFWAVAFGSMLPTIRKLWVHFKGHKPEIITWSLLFAALVISSRFFAFSCDNYRLGHHWLKTSLLTYTGGGVALMAAVGSILVNIGLRDVLAKSAASAEEASVARVDKQQILEEKQGELVREYLDLRASLLLFLSILGIMLGLVVLAQGAKRYFIQNASDGCASDFTPDKVMIFGLYYTLILILTFLPTFSLLIATGHRLRDDLLPIPSPHSNQWKDRCARREKLEALLALSMTESIRAVLAVAGPIFGALISLLQFILTKPKLP